MPGSTDDVFVFGADPDAGGRHSEGAAFNSGSITISPIDGNFAAGDIPLDQMIAHLLGTSYGIPGDGYSVSDNAAGGHDIDVIVPAALRAAAGTDAVDLAIYDGAGAVTLPGNVENATLRGHGNADVVGNASANILKGNAGSNMLTGAAGDDLIKGGAGDDILVGDNGRDRLYGGCGDDALTGGGGDDRLRGGAGSDTFIFAANSGDDHIADFDATHDRIAFTAGQFENFDALLAASSQSGGDVRIDAADGSDLVIDHVALNAFHADNFDFA